MVLMLYQSLVLQPQSFTYDLLAKYRSAYFYMYHIVILSQMLKAK